MLSQQACDSNLMPEVDEIEAMVKIGFRSGDLTGRLSFVSCLRCACASPL